MRGLVGMSWAAAFAIGAAVAAARSHAAEPPETPAEAVQAQGARLFQDNGCNACHGEARRPLEALSTYTDDELKHLIQAPASPNMPQFHLSDEQLSALVAYLKKQYP